MTALKPLEEMTLMSAACAPITIAAIAIAAAVIFNTLMGSSLERRHICTMYKPKRAVSALTRVFDAVWRNLGRHGWSEPGVMGRKSGAACALLSDRTRPRNRQKLVRLETGSADQCAAHVGDCHELIGI